MFMSALAAPGTDELLKFQTTFSTQVISLTCVASAAINTGRWQQLGRLRVTNESRQ
jgi:hypothetical protein